jgi:hypothetical protein
MDWAHVAASLAGGLVLLALGGDELLPDLWTDFQVS